MSSPLGILCAHAPALAPLPLDPDLKPRAAAEELDHTFFSRPQDAPLRRILALPWDSEVVNQSRTG
jgi:hypothetical protein